MEVQQKSDGSQERPKLFDRIHLGVVDRNHCVLVFHWKEGTDWVTGR